MSGRGLRIEEDMNEDLRKLGVPQLLQLNTQIEQELNIFQDSLVNLKMAHSKLLDSKEAVEQISPEHQGREMLVPLTASVFVKGNVVEPEKLLIAVGAGYFIETSSKTASDYFSRKSSFVTEEMEKLKTIGNEKSKERAVVTEVLQLKLQELTTRSA